MNMKILTACILCGVMAAAANTAEIREIDAAEAVVASAPGTVFLQGEKLEFDLKFPSAAEWRLLNWKDEEIRRGTGMCKLVLAPLPDGYYKLELKADGVKFHGFRSFAVVPDPGGRERNPDSFFAMDSAQSWLARHDSNNPRQPEDSFALVSEVARRAGLRMVRERLNWAETEPVPGEFDWKQYKVNADLLAERGVGVLGMYHHAPAWTRRDGEKLPSDLAAAYRFARKAAETLQGRMTAWEFWNEQDIGFATEAAWDYAAAFKAASLGFKAADPGIPVAIGGFAITPLLPFDDAVMENGAGEYFDIFNFHTYRAICEFPDALGSVRKFLARHGVSDRPVWVTENGSNMEGSGAKNSFLPGLKAHSPEQEMLIAEYVPKAMITLQFLGVDRDFFFVLPPFNESGGAKDWGLMRRDFTVKPGYAAFATLTDRLENAAPEGEVRLGPGLKGRLYRRKDGTKILVYWSLSELDTDKPKPNLSITGLNERKFSLPLSGTLKGVDLFGTPFTAEASEIPASRYPRYLQGVDTLKADIPFSPRKTALLPERKDGLDKTIVFRTELSPDFTLFVGKDCADVKRDSSRLKLQVWNLSDREKTGVVSVSGGKTEGVPPRIVLPPFEKREFELAFSPRLDGEFKGELRVDGVFEGRAATPLVIPLRSLDAMSAAGRKQEMPQMLDPANWRKNTSGTTKIDYDETGTSIVFTTHFPAAEKNRWTYPEYALQLPQESLRGALGMEFEVKVSRASDVMQMLLMAVPEKGKDVYLKVSPPGEKFETRFVPFPPSPDPAKIVRLRLGVNAHGEDITVSVRNIRIFYRR